MKDSSNAKKQFPPRKQSYPSTPTNLQTQPVNTKECILNYQKDIELLKQRIQDLEAHLEHLTEPDSNLFQLYDLAQTEWSKLTDEHFKLKSFVSKDKNQIPNLQQHDTELLLVNIENQRLKSEIEKKNAIIREIANQPFFSSSLNNDENQVKKLTIENTRLKNELENATLALSLNNNVMSLDTFNKILTEKQKNKSEPNEELRLLQEENKSLRSQIHELESEIYDISNNNPELQASLEAERQLRKINRELEEKIAKLENQLNSNRSNQKSIEIPKDEKQEPSKNKPSKSHFPDFDDDDEFFDDFDKFEKEVDLLDDDLQPLKNTSDEDDENEEKNAENTDFSNKGKILTGSDSSKKNKEFELTGDMAMFSAILAPLKKKLDERCRQVEIEKMKEQGVFSPIKDDNENDGNDLGVDLIDNKDKDEKESNDNNNDN